MKKSIFIILFIGLILNVNALANNYKIVYINIFKSEIKNDFQITDFLKNSDYQKIYETIRKIADSNHEYNNFSFNLKDFYLNYYCDANLSISTGYLIKDNHILMEKFNLFFNEFDTYVVNKEDVDLNLKLGEILKLEDNYFQKYIQNKVIIKEISSDYYAIYYSYNNLKIGALLLRQ